MVSTETNQSLFKKGRIMYIFEALFEYLISILVAGSYLATLTKQLEFSDSLTGILSSVISLGCSFQLISIAFRVTKAKPFVIILSIINQALFMSLYLIPFSGFGNKIKTVLFIIAIILAYFTYNLAHPKKMNWLMSLVDDKRRGNFTANKEIISLLAGMLFSFAMGALLDYFEVLGKLKTALLILAAVIFFLLVMHTLSLIHAYEKPQNKRQKTSIKQSVVSVIKNKRVLTVTLVYVFYYISNYMAVPFYGTYQISELGFNLKTVSLLAILGSVSRIIVSKFWGKYADKKSFAAMIEKCFIILAISYGCVAAAMPGNGLVMFILYYVFHGIAMGGINSALTNLVFDYSPYEIRSDALAISQAIAGLVGFLTTICVSPLITQIQQNGNHILGIPVYAQQIVSAASLVLAAVAALYVRKVLINKKKTS